MPDELSSWSAPRFVPGTDRLVLHGRRVVDGRGVIATVRADGRGYACLSCSLPEELDLGRPQALSDGRRILVQSPQSSNEVDDHDHAHYVLTCTPSIANCLKSELTPIEGMAAKGSFQERWPAVAPDDEHIAWTRLTPSGFRMLLGNLERRGKAYRVSDVRALNTRVDDGTVRGWSLGSAWFEVKGFADGGRTLLFASTLAQASNLDAYEMDLETGAIRRTTADPDWDEESQVSADGTYFMVGSSRGRNVLTNLTLVPAPPLFDFALAPAVTRYYLAGDKRRSAQHGLWLFPRGVARPDEQGLLLSDPESGWFRTESIGSSSDSTRIAWSELQPGSEVRRVLVGHFPDMPPRRPIPVQATPSVSWALPVERLDLELPTGKVELTGAAGGRAKLLFSGTLAGGSFRARFEQLSEGDGLVTDGEQSLDNVLAFGKLEQSLELSGCETGSAEASLRFRGGEREGCASASRGAATSSDCY